MKQHTVEWLDHGREPRVKPNPDYPNGKDVVDPHVTGDSCKVDLPYPAKRIGLYIVTCGKCGLRVGVTTAGRPDDPRSITMACKRVNA